jgi:zinc transport system substrate-binding protein
LERAHVIFFRCFVVVLFVALGVSQSHAAPKVVVSIVPLHSLVAQVMAGVGEPELLMQGNGSEHQASFGPQQLQALGAADVVFTIGKGLELKLGELSGTETVSGKTFIEVSAYAGITLHPRREGGAWAEGAHDHDHDHEKHLEDVHIWLSPANAAAIITGVKKTLSEHDPKNAARYDNNAATALLNLQKLDREIKAQLAEVKDRGFLVFHDAFQYFEKHYELSAQGSISDAIAAQPTAQRLAVVREIVKNKNVKCVFREPQYSDAAAKTVIEGTAAKLDVLDPIGAELSPGPLAYDQIIRGISSALVRCLAQ